MEDNLDLSKKNIEVLEEGRFDKSTSLKKLDLSSNKFTQLPPNIFNTLSNLNWLSLKNNRLGRLDERLFTGLMQLKHLDLDNTQQIELHENLFHDLVNLEKLSIMNNKLQQLNSSLFSNLTKLQRLFLTTNQLTDIDVDQFKNLRCLEYLSLHENGIQKLNTNLFDSLVSLKHLYLGINQLSALNKLQFGKLIYLERLDLTHNCIQVLPENIFTNSKCLKLLSISHNRLIKLDENIFDSLESLEQLFLENNQLTNLNEKLFANLKNLRQLNISNNLLKQLHPNQFSQLFELDYLFLSGNQLSALDKNQFTCLSKLTILSLENNQIEELDGILFGELKLLKNVNLSRNRIRKVNDGQFDIMKNLKFLDLSCNRLDYFEMVDFKFLTDLNLFNNKLKVVSLASMDLLENLDLSSNSIESTEEFENVGARLTCLKLNKNKIKLFDFNTFPKLKELHLQENPLSNVVNCQENSGQLQEFYVYDNKLPYIQLGQIQDTFKLLNGKLKIQEVDLKKEQGHIYSIHIDSSTLFPQLKNFNWYEIPMFSVITGKNGVGKSSMLKFIRERLEYFYKTQARSYSSRFIELKSRYFSREFLKSNVKVIPLTLKTTDTVETFGDSTFFNEIVQKDEEVTSSSWRSNIDTADVFNLRSKADIYSFRSVDACLKYLHSDLDKLNDYLDEQNEFKYKRIEYLDIEGVYVFNTSQFQVKLGDLSPGEHLILLMLLWQFIFVTYEVYGKTILLFDEPDAHLHPSAVIGFLKILKKLAQMGVQIIMTTHNPTTTSFVDNENLFLMYECDKEKHVKIRKGTTQYEINNFLSCNLVNIEIPSKTVFVEGKDAPFYKAINKYLNRQTFFKCPFNFQLNIQPLSETQQNKETLIDTIKALGESNKVFAIVDDDGDQDCNKVEHLRNLLYLRRDGKENYALDPINVFFYLKRKLLENPSNHLLNNKLLNNFYEEVQEEISKIDSKYTKYALNSIVDSIYSSSDDQERKNCANILQLIVDNFFRLLINRAVDAIVDKDLTTAKLFKLPLLITNQKLSNNFERSKVIQNIESEIKSDIKKLLKDEKINRLICLNESKCFDENLKTVLEKYNQINKNINPNDIYFDLTKCASEKFMSENKKSLVRGKIKIDKNQISLEYYFKLKNIAHKAEIYQRYKEFSEFDSVNKENTKSRLKELLSQKRHVSLNRYTIEYPNLFISFDDHELEKLYNKVLTNCEIKSDKLVEQIDSNGFFLPDDIVSMFRRLCNNIHELTPESFTYMVYNTDLSWKVHFTIYSHVYSYAFLLEK